MVRGTHVPRRTCVGCGRQAAKGELVRVVLVDGRPAPDRDGRHPGRGAYVCGRECAAEAVRRRTLARAFRRTVPDVEDFVESIT